MADTSDTTFREFQAATIISEDGSELDISLECVDIDSGPDIEEICPSCNPNPNALEPNWKLVTPMKVAFSSTIDGSVEPEQHGTPYLNEKTCEYSIVVRTHYETAIEALNETGEDSVLDAINNGELNRAHYIIPAIRALLRYYGKMETDTVYDSDGSVINVGTVDALEYVTKAVDFHVGLRPFLKMTVLITVPALNFDQIEDAPVGPSATATSMVKYELKKLRGYGRRVSRVFPVYQRYLSFYEKEYSGGLFFETGVKLVLSSHHTSVGIGKSAAAAEGSDLNERTFLREAITLIFDYIYSRGYKTRGGVGFGRKVATSVEIGFEESYSALKYIKVIQEGCEETPETFSGDQIRSLTERGCFQRPTTLGYLARLEQMNTDLLARVPKEWLTFVKEYTYPAVSVNYGTTLPGALEEDSLAACISDNLNLDEFLEAQLKGFISLPQVILSKFSTKLCRKIEENIDAASETGIDQTTSQAEAAGYDDTAPLGSASNPVPDLNLSPKPEDVFGFPLWGGNQESRRESQIHFVNSAVEASIAEFFKDDNILEELPEILKAIGDADGVEEKLKKLKSEFLGKIKACGMYALLLRAIQCLTGGLSLEVSLMTIIESALRAMDIHNLHKLFIGLPMNVQIELEERVKEKLAEALGEAFTPEEGFEGGLFSSRQYTATADEPYYYTIETPEYTTSQAILTSENVASDPLLLDLDAGISSMVYVHGVSGALVDVSNYESLRGFVELTDQYVSYKDAQAQNNGSFISQVANHSELTQVSNLGGEDVFGQVTSDIGKELLAAESATPPTSKRRTLAPSREGGAYLAAGGDTIPGVIITTYIDTILDYYLEVDGFEGLLASLNALPGAEVVFRILEQLDCSVPPLFDPSIPDFLKSIDFAVCRSQKKIQIPKFQNPMVWLKGLDPLSLIKEAITEAITELIWKLIFALVAKILEAIMNALCKALEIVGQIVKEAVTGGEVNLRSIIREAICGPEAMDEDIDQTIADIFNSIGGGASPNNTDSINSLVEDVSNALAKEEMVDLLKCRPNDNARRVVSEIIETRHPDFAPMYSSHSKVGNLFCAIGSLMPIEYLHLLDRTDDTPLAPPGECSPKEYFDESRCAILVGKGEDPRFCKELLNKEDQQAIDDLSDLSGVMQKGVGAYIAENLPDIMGMPCDVEAGRAIIKAVPDELQVINNDIVQKMFEIALLMLTEDLSGNRGMLSYILSDTVGHTYAKHVRKEERDWAIMAGYVDDWSASGVDSDANGEQDGEIDYWARFERGYLPETVGIWLAHQILQQLDEELWLTSDITTTAEETVSYTMPEVMLATGGLITGETISVTIPEKQNPHLRLTFKDNDDGRASGAAEKEYIFAGKDVEYDYGFYLDYFQSIVAIRSGIEMGTNPGAVENAVITDDISRIRILEITPAIEMQDRYSTLHGGNVLCDFNVTSSMDSETVALKATFDLGEDATVGSLDGSPNASTGLTKTPQSEIFQQYLSKVLDSVGVQVAAPTARDVDYKNVTQNTIKRFMQFVAIDPTNEQNGITPAFFYGSPDEDEVSDIDMVYVNPGAKVYAPDGPVSTINPDDLYSLEEELQIVGRSATDPGDGTSRVHFLDPAKYGGRYSNPPIYIGPPRKSGWMAFAEAVAPQLTSCPDQELDDGGRLLNYNDIVDRVNWLLQNTPEDERLAMNPDCVLEVPYARIMDSSAIAGSEGAVLATIRTYLIETMVKGMATFSKFMVSEEVFGEAFVQYIISNMEKDIRENGKRFGPLKDDGYWYAFLEQSVQIVARMIESGDLEVENDSLELRTLTALNDMQDAYIYPMRDEHKLKTSSGLLGNQAFVTAALIAGGILAPGLALGTVGTLISGGLTGAAMSRAVTKYMVENGYVDDVPLWYADRLEIGYKVTLKAYREAKKLLYIKRTEDEAKVLLGRLILTQLDAVGASFRDKLLVYEPKLSPNIYDLGKHFLGSSKMCYGSTLRVDMYDFDDPDPTTGLYSDEFYAASYNGAGDALNVAAWAGTVGSGRSGGRTNPLDGIPLSQISTTEFAPGSSEIAEAYNPPKIAYDNDVIQTRVDLQVAQSNLDETEALYDPAKTDSDRLEMEAEMMYNAYLVEKDIYTACLSAGGSTSECSGLQPAVDAAYEEYLITNADYETASELTEQYAGLIEQYQAEIDELSSISLVANDINCPVGGYKFSEGEFIVEKYIYVEDKIEADGNAGNPRAMAFSWLPSELTDRSDYLRGVVNLEEFEAYLLGGEDETSGTSPNDIPDVNYGFGLLGGDSPVIDPENLISTYFGDLEYTYDENDTEQTSPTGIKGSTGLRYGLRVSFVPSNSLASQIEAAITDETTLKSYAQHHKAFYLETPTAYTADGTEVNHAYDDFHRANVEGADGDIAAGKNAKYLIPVAVAEIDVLDGPIGEFSIDNYDMACLADKLVNTAEFKLLFKYVFPLDKFLSIVGIYNAEAFFPSIGQHTENYKQRDYGFFETEEPGALDPRTVGEWSSIENRTGLVFQSDWDRWDRKTFEKSKKTMRDMFLAFYNMRDFTYDEKKDRMNLIEALQQMGMGGLGRERLKWWTRRRNVTSPFSASGEECEIWQLI